MTKARLNRQPSAGEKNAPGKNGKLVPIAQDFEPFDLDTAFLHTEPHPRWLLTTCIAGITGTLLVGGLVLGLFGRNASLPDALAAVEKSKLVSEAYDPLAKIAVIGERDLSGGYAYPEITRGELPYNKENTRVLDADIQSATIDGDNITTITKTPPPEPVDVVFTLATGSTLAAELTQRGVPSAAAEAMVAALNPVLTQNQIKAGTRFDVTFDRQIDFYGREVTFPVELSFTQPGKGLVTVESDEDGQFTASLNDDSGNKTQAAAKSSATQFHTISKIGSSLYTAAKDQRVPDYIISEFTHMFSYDVDFQRQVNSSDTFELFFGNPLSGSSAKRKVLHMARLTIDGEARTFYRFTTADGTTDYFDESGHSAARSLLRTPVSGAHLTSAFGMRIHPLLGYSKMHTGTDFGAAFGTPIRAAGDGEIAQAGHENGYGNVVTITHSDSLETIYAHMARFAAGIHEGVHVNQGQVIGYVGSTGRSTGPHLHFEVRIDDKPVNPMTVRSAGGRRLTGRDLVAFRGAKEKLLAMMQTAPSSREIAQASN